MVVPPWCFRCVSVRTCVAPVFPCSPVFDMAASRDFRPPSLPAATAGPASSQTATLPLVLPEKLAASRVLLELEPRSDSAPGGSAATDFSGDSGAIGRWTAVPRDAAGRDGGDADGLSHAVARVDLKGVLYRACAVPCPMSIAIVSLVPGEARVDALFSQVIQLRLVGGSGRKGEGGQLPGGDGSCVMPLGPRHHPHCVPLHPRSESRHSSSHVWRSLLSVNTMPTNRPHPPLQGGGSGADGGGSGDPGSAAGGRGRRRPLLRPRHLRAGWGGCWTGCVWVGVVCPVM